MLHSQAKKFHARLHQVKNATGNREPQVSRACYPRQLGASFECQVPRALHELADDTIPEGQSGTLFVAFSGVVKDNIHQHLYATLVALFDHGLELLDHILPTSPLGSSLAVPCHRGKEANG